MSTERRLLRYLAPHSGWFVIALLTAFGASMLDGITIVLLIPLLRYLFGTAGALGTHGASRLEAWIDWFTAPIMSGASPGVAAARILALLVLGLFLKNLLSYVTKQIQVAIQESLVRDMRTDLFAHLLRLDLDYFRHTKVGQLVSALMVDVDQVKSAVTAALATLFQNMVVLAITLLILSQISWRLTVLVLGAAPILVIGMRSLLRRLRRHSRARAEERGDIMAMVTERLSLVKLIRASGEEAGQVRQFRAQSQDYRKKVIRTNRFSSLMGPVSEMFGGLLIILIIFAGLRPGVLGGQPLRPEVVVVFLIAALKMMSPVKRISEFPASIAVARASAQRVFRLLDEPETERNLPGERQATFTREIRYENVAFRYREGPQVLSDVSFVVPRGAIVAVVGPSGAGKTTLVDLLPRFYEPTGGRITMDGISLTQLTRDSIRALMGLVGQETMLLNDTVAANIAFGAPGASPARIEHAAAAANAVEFIDAMPAGYETMLGERGTRLSGGQRQRIAIARALLRDPPILILDEATSALDPVAERLVQEAIDRVMRDRTVIVIAHRLSTVRNADHILVLDAGRIVEQGTHESLYRADGLYRRLYDLQFQETPERALEEASPRP